MQVYVQSDAPSVVKIEIASMLAMTGKAQSVFFAPVGFNCRLPTSTTPSMHPGISM
jgi:hypothetical protein